MVLRGLLLFFMLASAPFVAASEQGSLVAGPSPFVLIARLHALPMPQSASWRYRETSMRRLNAVSQGCCFIPLMRS
jgi:hypothetical protein